MAILAAGDIREITANNPDVGIIFFDPVSGEDNQIDVGGLRADDTKAVTSSGTLINSYKRVVAMTEILVAADTYPDAVAIAGSTKETVWTIAMLNGTVYKGAGVIQGDLAASLYKGTYKLSIVSGLGFVIQ